jgi:hypothetical protein
MRKAIILVVAALTLGLSTSAALAGGNPGHGKGGSNGGGKGAPKVVYVLKGKLSAYTPYNSSTSTNGSITIAVSQANYHGKSLKGQTLTFPVDANTKVSLPDGVTTITDNDQGIVKVKAAKKIAAADLATTLQATAAKQIVDQQGTSG